MNNIAKNPPELVAEQAPGGDTATPEGRAFWQQALSWGLFPVTVLATAASGIWLMEAQDPRLMWLRLAVAGPGLLLLFGLEWLLPHRAAWNSRRDGDLLTDVLHNTIGASLYPARSIVKTALLTATIAWLAARFGSDSLWPSTWPLAAQVVLLVVLGEFFYYWAHRFAHEYGLLWRLHSTHHSPSRLYWFNADRFHPFDMILLSAARAIPAIFLGAEAAPIVVQGLLVAYCGKLQHANVDMRFGILNQVFATADWHRWHHSTAQTQCNYGNILILWDRVFGTAYLPQDGHAPDELGLVDMPAFPTGYFGQLLAPFRWRTLEKESRQQLAAEDPGRE